MKDEKQARQELMCMAYTKMQLAKLLIEARDELEEERGDN